VPPAHAGAPLSHTAGYKWCGGLVCETAPRSFLGGSAVHGRRGGTRTRMGLTQPGLSRPCLPVPPPADAPVCHRNGYRSRSSPVAPLPAPQHRLDRFPAPLGGRQAALQPSDRRRAPHASEARQLELCQARLQSSGQPAAGQSALLASRPRAAAATIASSRARTAMVRRRRATRRQVTRSYSGSRCSEGTATWTASPRSSVASMWPSARRMTSLWVISRRRIRASSRVLSRGVGRKEMSPRGTSPGVLAWATAMQGIVPGSSHDYHGVLMD
jgi:hypothetical protein